MTNKKLARACSSCDYWKKIEVHLPDAHHHPMGACRRYPPDTTKGWRLMPPEEWCGEYREWSAGPRGYGVQIADYREKHGLSLKKFGVLVGCSYQAVLGWEAGEYEPQVRFRRKLDKLLRGKGGEK